MSDSFDRDKVVDCMFDAVTSSLIAELEDGEKDCTHLASIAYLSEDDVKEKLNYLIQTGFIDQRSDGKKTFFSANAEKLTQIIEDNENFDSAIKGLETMDSYLN